ncbi:MAG: DNA polymerase III subunit alpha [Anaerolineales bacterium]|nr:DNA polymerase III subunit alpha [Anaerolineales bacterium]
MFVHLATHSQFSFLRGLPAPAQLAAAAAAAGQPVLALCDHNRLSGAIEFSLACQTAGIRPILGMTVRLQAGQPLTLRLLAINAQGWTQLCQLSSWLQGEPNGDERSLPLAQLQQHAEGLICLADAPHPELGQLFGDRFYRAGVDAALWPVYYLQPQEAGLQRLAAAIRTNTPLSALPADASAPAHFPSAAEMQARFSPAALAATWEIAERCQFDLPLGQPNFPQPDLPPGQDAQEALRRRAYAGAQRHYGEISQTLRARLDHELQVIQASGYTTLFLIMEEILGFARRAGVPISSRGSAASSLVAHCLEITTPDPMRLNLYFERFLNPARPNPPDIDTDLCSRRRDVVIRHVYEHYGADRVAMVATINRFRRRSALREVAKAHGLPPAEIKRMVDSLPYRYWGPGHHPEDPQAYADLESRFRSPQHQRVFADAQALIGLPHHLSIHPGGIVISSSPLTDTVPTQFSGKGITITQYDLEGVQHMGLVKMDLLGTRGLTVLGDVADHIRQHSAAGSQRLQVLDEIPDHDPLTAEMVRNGRTIGCFQIESPGMRATLRETQADSVDNVMAALALFRPGPLTGGLKDAFVRRHLGRERVEHIHPALEPLLAETHGVFLYQEQVLRVAHELAGFSLAESDLLRRAMSHFDPGKQMQTLKEKFVRGAGEIKQVPPAVAERIWDMMAAFSGYGFPKAHAASYAQVAWRSAWCKAHYPAEFMAAVLANWGGYYGQETYLLEALRMGLRLHPPHINHSQRQFSVSYIEGQPRLYMGLDQLRELGRETQRRIIALRPFSSLGDFLTRAYPRPVEARRLIQVGALEGLGLIPHLLEELEQGAWRRGQLPLFEAPAAQSEDWSEVEKAETQRELLGVALAAHPLDTFAAQAAAAGALNTLEAAGRAPGAELRVAGMRQTWRRVQTSRGGYLYFMDLADFEGTLRVVIPDEVYRRDRQAFNSRDALLVTGRLESGRESPEPVLQATRLAALGPAASRP